MERPEELTPGAALSKPPTQIAGVQGFVAFEAKPTRTVEDSVWRRLIELPPFQMFAAEQMPNTKGYDSVAHAVEFIQSRAASPAIVAEYETWHAQKGYWKDETPIGEPKDA